MASVVLHWFFAGRIDWHMPVVNLPAPAVNVLMAVDGPRDQAAPERAMAAEAVVAAEPGNRPDRADLTETAQALPPNTAPAKAPPAAAPAAELPAPLLPASPAPAEVAAPSAAVLTDAGNVSIGDPVALEEIYVADDSKSEPLRKLEMEFDIRRSIDGGAVGATQVSYEVGDDNRYRITSVSKARGVLSLFLSGTLLQTSEGSVTEQGLQPASFLYQFGNKGEKTQRAYFDWQSGQLTLETGRGKKSEPLPVGAQDLLSFMYQFMFEPPQQQMQLAITNGKKLDTYDYVSLGEESIKSRLGEIRAVHIVRQADANQEKTELWLALDYQYLPVKIRRTEEDGSVIEQVVTRIATDEQGNSDFN